MINKLLRNKKILFVFALTLSLVMPSIAFAQTNSDYSSSQALTGVTSSGAKCTSYWNWYVDQIPNMYSKVEWTSNPCGFTIQDRSYCSNNKWVYSGTTKRKDIWVRASCDPLTQSIHKAQQRFRSASGWSKWSTYWHLKS